MDDVSMSPEELRKRLKDYGISTGPITPTTFPVYVRKLNSLRSRNSRVNRESRNPFATASQFSSSTVVSSAANLNGFSSDESDAENEGRRDRCLLYTSPSPRDS